MVAAIEIESKYAHIEKRFAATEADCAKSFQEKSLKPLDEDLSEKIWTALDKVADCVALSIQEWIGERGSTGLNVYFWPGYERILGHQGRALKRPLHESVVDPNALDYEKILGEMKSGSGIYYGKHKPSPYPLDMNAFWFNVALGSTEQQGHPLKGFIPGSTHDWFRGANLTRDKDLPDLLAIEVGGQGRKKGFEQGFNSYGIHVALDAREPGKWASKIQEQIAAQTHSKTGRDVYWPSPHSDREFDNRIRLAQYDLWLTGCFDPERSKNMTFVKQVLERPFLEQGQRYLPMFSEYTKFLEAGLGLMGKYGVERRASYTAWYAAPLFQEIPPAYGSRQKIGPTSLEGNVPYLGTVMLLTSKPLDIDCIRILKNSIRAIYMQIRQVEAGALERRAGAAGLSKSFGHEIAKLGNALLGDYLQKTVSVASWPDTPIELSSTLSKETRKFIDEWRIATVPNLYRGFRYLFDVWGASDFRSLGLEFPLTLRGLIDVLQPSAAEIAAARILEGDPAPASLEGAMALADLFDETVKNRATFKVEEIPDGVRDIRFESLDSKYAEIPQFLLRLLLAAMSNISFHAPAGTQVSVNVEFVRQTDGQEGLILKFVNYYDGDLSSADVDGDEFEVKTEGVCEACLERLRGTMKAFGLNSEGRWETSFFLPYALVSNQPWIGPEK